MHTLRSKEIAPIYGDEKKLEVALVDGMTVIKLFDWVDGLGWSCQKTLSLDDFLVEDLHRALSAVRCRMAKKSEHDGKIINFPVIS